MHQTVDMIEQTRSMPIARLNRKSRHNSQDKARLRGLVFKR